jgi:hypothetical protein
LEPEAETGNREKNLLLIAFGKYNTDASLDRFKRSFEGYTIRAANLSDAQQMLVVWGEADARKALDKVSHDVMRAGLFRYVAAYHLGGYYMDLKAGFQPRKDVRCLERLSTKSWFALSKSGKLTNWNMFAVRGSPLFAFVKDKIVSEILRGRTPKGKTFEQKAWDTTGPHALKRSLDAYQTRHGAFNAQPSEKSCLIYDVRGAGTSWKDFGFYHSAPDNKSVYV